MHMCVTTPPKYAVSSVIGYLKVACPPRTGPGSELVLWQDLRPTGGQDEAEAFYGGAGLYVVGRTRN